MTELSQKVNINVGNNAQTILPVPLSKKPVPSVAEPTYYGQSPYPMALKQTSRKNDSGQYCNSLSPPPRNQQLNVPYQGKKNCPEFKAQPFKRDSCYLMDNKAQGVVGVVCNQAGGSDNANFKRGGQFGVDYNWNMFDDIKEKEYTVEQPVQLPVNMQNPVIVGEQSLFYPTTNYYLSKSKDYKTYPRPNNMTNNGLPTYTYPYEVLNPRDLKKSKNTNNYNYHRNNLENLDNIENFINLNQNENMKKMLLLLLFLLIILIIIYYMKKK